MHLVLFKFKDGKQPHSVKTSYYFTSSFKVLFFVVFFFLLEIW